MEEKKLEYDEIGWGNFTATENGFGTLISTGERMKIPTEKLHESVRNLVERLLGRGELEKVFLFMSRAKTGKTLYSAEEAREVGIRAYTESMDKGDFQGAIGLAYSIFGPDSQERKAAIAADTAATKKTRILEKERRKNKIEILKAASFSALFSVLESVPEELSDLFYGELVDNFDPEIAEEFVERLSGTKQRESANSSFLEFLKSRGYNQKDVLKILPLKFI